MRAGPCVWLYFDSLPIGGRLGCPVLAGPINHSLLSMNQKGSPLIFPNALLDEMALRDWNIFWMGERKDKGGLGTESP